MYNIIYKQYTCDSWNEIRTSKAERTCSWFRGQKIVNPLWQFAL